MRFFTPTICRYGGNTAELILFMTGLVLLIPPVPSEPTTQVHFVPQGIIAATLFLLSRLISWRRRKETFLMMLAQVAGFIVFSLLLYQRFQYRSL
jgi:ABC-type Fe3+-siderophore transport system permease subunit